MQQSRILAFNPPDWRQRAHGNQASSEPRRPCLEAKDTSKRARVTSVPPIHVSVFSSPVIPRLTRDLDIGRGLIFSKAAFTRSDEIPDQVGDDSRKRSRYFSQ